MPEQTTASYDADEQMFEVPGSRLRELTDQIAELRAAMERVRSLTYNTDGDPLRPDSEIPVGEVSRMLGSFA